MVKFVVVVRRKPGTTHAEFRRRFDEIHVPLARRLPNLVRYVRNFPTDDPLRPPPGWDAVVELYFSDRDAMESAWGSAAGRAATADLEICADLSSTSWALVEQEEG
ncbi:MAG: EthD family reductase [Chloroflexi bacterium]|nr:EthD family reductase [Chloroflexota bacterium]